jgi:acetyltransferase-like isoleucine patch superfamily enzyme
MFINDIYPHAITHAGSNQCPNDWTCSRTRVTRNASIGSSAIIVGDVCIDEHAVVGSGLS